MRLRGLGVSSDPRQIRKAQLLVGASAVALAVVLFVILSVTYGHPGDIATYLAAGERLNAGHPLYSLSPGDRQLPIIPPYWTVPLLSPPLVGVMWRPLAVLPESVSVTAWWISMIGCLAIVVVMVLRVPRMLGPIALYVLSISLGLEAVQGNINALILLGTIVAWRAYASGRPEIAGAIVGALVVLKVTPAILAVWILVAGGRRGLIGFAAGVLSIGLVSLLGAGLDAHLAYLTVMRDTTTIGPSDLSLAGMLRTFGLPPDLAARLGLAVDVAGIIAVIALRSRPATGFRAAVITLVAGSPVVFVNTYLLLLPALAPSLWPMKARQPQVGTSLSSTIAWAGERQTEQIGPR